MEKPSTPRATSAVVALMHEVLASSIDVVLPAPERQVLKEVAATTSGTMATPIAPEPEVEIEAATVLEVMATDPSSEPSPSTNLAVVSHNTTNSEAHADPLGEIHLEEIQLIDVRGCGCWNDGDAPSYRCLCRGMLYPASSIDTLLEISTHVLI